MAHRSISSEQCEHVQETLEQLSVQNQANRDAQLSKTDCRGTQTDRDASRARAKIQDEIEQVMDSLIAYSHEKDKKLHYDEAEPIIESLDRIFEILFDIETARGMKRKRGVSDASTTNVTCTEAKRLKRTIGSSQQLVLNGRGS